MLWDIIRSGAASVLRRKKQISLTVFGIAIGVFSVLIISVIGSAGSKLISSELSKLGFDCITLSASDSSVNDIDRDSLSLIKDSEGVNTAAPLVMRNGQVMIREYISDAMVCGVDSNALKIISMEIKSGRFLTNEDILESAYVCVVDEKLGKEFYGRSNIIGKSLELKIAGNIYRCKVIGISDGGEGILNGMVGEYIPSLIYMPYTTIQEITSSDAIDTVFVKLNDAEKAQQVGARITKDLSVYSGGTNLYRYDDLSVSKDRLESILNAVTSLLSAIGAISIVVSGFNIMTVMTVSVKERTKEIGIKKAIGAKNSDILAEFITEAVLISIAGGCLGSAICLGAVYAAKIWGIILEVNLREIIFTVLFSGLIGVIFGVYPAKQASKLNPVDALRFE